MVELTVNGQTGSVDADADTPLLYVLRDHLERSTLLNMARPRLMRRLHGDGRRRGGIFVFQHPSGTPTKSRLAL